MIKKIFWFNGALHLATAGFFSLDMWACIQDNWQTSVDVWTRELYETCSDIPLQTLTNYHQQQVLEFMLEHNVTYKG